MAIDTRSKRASVLGLVLPFRQHFPVPDGTLGQPDRAHLLGLYSGYEYAAPANDVVDTHDGEELRVYDDEERRKRRKRDQDELRRLVTEGVEPPAEVEQAEPEPERRAPQPVASEEPAPVATASLPITRADVERLEKLAAQLARDAQKRGLKAKARDRAKAEAARVLAEAQSARIAAEEAERRAEEDAVRREEEARVAAEEAERQRAQDEEDEMIIMLLLQDDGERLAA